MTEARQAGATAPRESRDAGLPHGDNARTAGAGGDARLLGIDIGGTKIALAVSTVDGAVLGTDVVPTGAADGAEAILARLAAAGHALLSRAGGPAAAVGAVGPGIIRPDGVALSPNISSWHQVRLAEELADRFGAPRVAVDNDVKAAGLAELRRGARRGRRVRLRPAHPGRAARRRRRVQPAGTCGRRSRHRRTRARGTG